jgi:hypothetical protein
MKKTILILTILILGLFLFGCTKSTTNNNSTNTIMQPEVNNNTNNTQIIATKLDLIGTWKYNTTQTDNQQTLTFIDDTNGLMTNYAGLKLSFTYSFNEQTKNGIITISFFGHTDQINFKIEENKILVPRDYSDHPDTYTKIN